ncbi:MAG: hypothetical protein WKG00_02760 [Polyangiaceae bacterium]
MFSATRAAPMLGALALICVGAPALAQQADPAKRQQAADAFDAGTEAFKQKDYASAAKHFEAADRALPSPKALRLAMRSRAEAGNGALAATWAALALARYPADAETSKQANDALDKLTPGLHKLNVSCASPCALNVGEEKLLGEPTTRWVVYLAPGPATVKATFYGDVAPQTEKISAAPGDASTLRFEPGNGDVAGAAAAAPVLAPGSSPSPVIDTPPDAPSSGSGLSPAFFIIGLVATAGVGGVTIWSGIDTQNNPGADTVRERCAGQGESCPEYQDGRDKQMRTNILIGATIGTGVLTAALGLFFTDWGGSSSASSSGKGPRPPRFVAAPMPVERGGGLVGSARF